MATASVSYRQIMSDLGKGKFASVYYLMGDEPFYIDSIEEYIRQNAIPEEDRDFNQLVVYGSDSSMKDIIARARSFPMGAQYQVIIVKEAQNLIKKDSDTQGSSQALDLLSSYLQQPQSSTILVFCHKNGSLDKRKKIVSDLDKSAILFESKKVKEDALPAFIDDYLGMQGKTMSMKSKSMMCQYIGTDLSRMAGELTKLVTAMPADVSEINPEFIEKHVGISKDFNVFEFKDAIINRDIYKANQIAAYFESNQKTNPIQYILATIYPFFMNLMLAFYAPDKSERGIMEQLDMKSPWLVKDYITGMKNYTAMKTMHIISAIRSADARSKGVGATANSTDGLLRELLYFILH